MSNDNNIMPRRQFISRAIKAGASVAVATTLAYKFYDKNGFDPDAGKELINIPDFSIKPQLGKTISIVNGSDRVKNVRIAIKSLGGIERFVSPGDVVVLKPNVAFASPAMLGSTTSPDIVAEVVRICYQQGKAKEVIVCDNPINDPRSCFAISGVGKAASDAGATIMLPKPRYISNTTLEKGSLIVDWPVFFEPLRRANKLIGIAPVKHHHRSGASMTMKNWYGLLDGRRNVFHQDINTIITELAMLIKPTLVILDGTVSMISNGPTGGSLSDLSETSTLIASTDQLAADTVGATLLSHTPDSLSYLRKAELAGVGTTDYQSLKPIITTAG